jgi:hypothetical protein
MVSEHRPFAGLFRAARGVEWPPKPIEESLMPYFVYDVTESPSKLIHLETFAKYREAKEFVRSKRAESGQVENIRMIFARNDVEAEKLLKTPREERVIGED